MLQKISNFIVNKKYLLFALMLLLAVICFFMMLKVEVNTDMTRYLPDDSPMRQGIDIMADEFPEMETFSTIRVMFDDLSDAQKQDVLSRLESIEYVERVAHEEDSSEYNKDGHTLYVISTPYEYRSEEELAIEAELDTAFPEYTMVWHNDYTGMPGVSIEIMLAVLMLVAILLLMCGSWVEPFLFLFVIGVAIAINMGTNIFQGSISETTFSIGAVLQLALSMDYSIILMNRYRQERLLEADRDLAMKKALAHSFSSVAASSLTTVAGLLMLVFMRFKIGMDLGVVLAKGVFLSMICVLTMLPGLILACENIIVHTEKKSLNFSMKRAAAFNYKFRHVMGFLLIALFIGAFILQSRTGITFTLIQTDEVADVFPADNTIVMIYENQDEDKISGLAAELERDENVKSVTAYSTTLAKQYTADEMAEEIASMGRDITLNPDIIKMLYFVYFSGGETGTMSMETLFNFLVTDVLDDPRFKALIDDEMREYLYAAQEELDDGKAQLVSDNYSRMIITTSYPDESAETMAFISNLNKYCTDNMDGRYYLVGNSAMNYEMQQLFDRELLLITLLTAIAIFAIVALTFRSLFIPLILVMLVQCGVYITVTITGLLSGSMYYLALLIVECILMGATIDYGILMTNYYCESRKTMSPKEALAAMYKGSNHTILTSGAILIVVTAILGYVFKEPTIVAIVNTISLGALCATLLILFVLPGVLALCDKVIIKKSKEKKAE